MPGRERMSRAEWAQQNPRSDNPEAEFWAERRAADRAEADEAEAATGYRPLDVGVAPRLLGCGKCGAVVWDAGRHTEAHKPTPPTPPGPPAH